MTLRHLRIFKTVCDYMSITKAADKLNMTQPAVSIAIKELEAFYSAQLFDRLGRKIAPTESGEKLLIYVNQILNGFDDSVADIRDASNLKVCRIGVNVTLSESYLPGLIQLLKQRMPSVAVRVFVNNNREIETHLAENDIDFALLDSPIKLPGRVIEKVLDEEMTLLCSPSLVPENKITMSQLVNIPLLVREKGSGCRSCIDRKFKVLGIKPNIVGESISSRALTRLAREGLGAVVMPSYLADEYIEPNRLEKISISDDRLIRHYYLAYLSSKYQTPTVKECLKIVKEYFNK